MGTFSLGLILNLFLALFCGCFTIELHNSTLTCIRGLICVFDCTTHSGCGNRRKLSADFYYVLCGLGMARSEDLLWIHELWSSMHTQALAPWIRRVQEMECTSLLSLPEFDQY